MEQSAGPPERRDDPPPPTAFGGSQQGSLKSKVLLIAGLAALGWGLFFLGRMAAGWMAGMLPYSVDQALGASVSEGYSAQATVCNNPELVGAVESIVNQLAAGLDEEYRELHVQVHEDKNINAFALPGGYIFVLTGILDNIEAPEEVIGVLGHEIGHVIHRHGIKRIAQSFWFRILLMQVLGDVAGIADVLAGQAGNLLSLKFDRDQETESDTFGVDLMIKTGFDPTPVPNFFERLPDHNLPEWFSTHPNPDGRADELRDRLRGLTLSDKKADVPTLEQLQAPCLIEEDSK